MLQNKQAICISNKTDPFAISNYQVAIPQIDILNELEIPISYHTRGGKPFDDFYKKRNIPKTLFYISICHTDDELRNRIEPGATSIQYRWDMAKMLIDDGHQVIIGLNPFVQEWVDCEVFIKECEKAGVKNVVVQPIHLNSEQILNLSKKELDNIGGNILTNAKKRDSPYYYAVKQLIDSLISKGINAYDTQNFNESNIMEAWHKGLNNATFKTYYDFYHWCLKNKADNDAIFFEEFYDFIKPDFLDDDIKYPIYNYITSVDRRYRKTRESGLSIPNRLTFKELCLFIWNDMGSVRNITRNETFAILGEITEDKELIIEADENGNYIYAFNKAGFEHVLIHPININKYD